ATFGGGGIFAVGFPGSRPSDGSAGRAVIAFGSTTNLPFTTVSGAEVTVDPFTIQNALNSGTNVTLQANTDVVVNKPVVASNAAEGTVLELDAGRSILLNAGINVGRGNLTLTANNPGALQSQRDPGSAAILSPASAILAATNVSLTLSGDPGPGISI